MRIITSLASAYILHISVFIEALSVNTNDSGIHKNKKSLSTSSLSVEPRSYFATCIPGLEEITAQELKQVGAHNIQIHRAGVSFTENADRSNNDENDDDDDYCDMEVGLRALMWCRVPHLIMERIGADCHIIHNRDELYSTVYNEIDVENMLKSKSTGELLTISCRCIVQNSKSLPNDLTHSHYTALTVKNAIVDKCRDLSHDGYTRPSVNTDDADIPFVIMLRGIDNDISTSEMILYRCINGSHSMHRRGYRQNVVMHKAAMKESMASALLLVAGWDKLVTASKIDGKPAILVDPMMGSGTFGIEAAYIAADIAPGLLRMKLNSNTPSILRWNSGQKGTSANAYWHRLVREALLKRKQGLHWLNNSGMCRILLNEMNSSAFSLAKQCFSQAGLLESSSLTLLNENCENVFFDDQIIVPGRSIIVSNPPWGLRLTNDVNDSWESLKIFLDRECAGTEGMWFTCQRFRSYFHNH